LKQRNILHLINGSEKNSKGVVICAGVHQKQIQLTTNIGDIALSCYATGKRWFRLRWTKLYCWWLGWPYRLTWQCVVTCHMWHTCVSEGWSIFILQWTPDTRADITAAPSYDWAAVGILWSPSVYSRIGWSFGATSGRGSSKVAPFYRDRRHIRDYAQRQLFTFHRPCQISGQFPRRAV